MKLSVILPTIRLERLNSWFERFTKSYTGEYEIIFISPYDYLPGEWSKKDAFWVRDWGSPVRCQQLGLLRCTGSLIHRAVDDSLYLPGELDKCVDIISQVGTEEQRDVVMNLRFTEGSGQTHRDMFAEEFYTFGYHWGAQTPYTPFNFQIINFGIYPREMITSIGGWDCYFETPAYAELDLSLRLQFLDNVVIMSPNTVLKCDWIPGDTGDHAPIHYGCQDDIGRFKDRYSTREYEDMLPIDINNWKNSPERWERRFGK